MDQPCCTGRGPACCLVSTLHSANKEIISFSPISLTWQQNCLQDTAPTHLNISRPLTTSWDNNTTFIWTLADPFIHSWLLWSLIWRVAWIHNHTPISPCIMCFSLKSNKRVCGSNARISFPPRRKLSKFQVMNSRCNSSFLLWKLPGTRRSLLCGLRCNHRCPDPRI